MRYFRLNQASSGRLVAGGVVALLLFAPINITAGSSSDGTFEITRSTFSPGTRVAAGQFTMNIAIGQPAVTPVLSHDATYEFIPGFLYGLQPANAGILDWQLWELRP